MGYVYKISNNSNEKVYIGMTTRTIEKRKKEHEKAYQDKNSRMYNFKIYKAMRDIGINNFSYEVLEECEDDLLPERERYWIQKYNSVYNGYNTALGGKGKPLINQYQIRAMKILYEHDWLLEDISKAVNVNKSDVGEILHTKYDIKTLKNANKSFGKPIAGINSKNSIDFDSISDAARYLISNNIPTTNKLASVISKISSVLDKENRTAYGFKWVS